MPLVINEGDRALLKQQIRRGEAVLVLGAGANFGSLTAAGTPIKDGRDLADHLASLMGASYQNEPLSDVCSAFEYSLGRDSLDRVLTREFTKTRPSESLKSLFQYSWSRVYTWNIDDALYAAARRAAQSVQFFNGMVDKVRESTSITSLEAVALHGTASMPEAGFIFSNQEYTRSVVAGSHAWYRQLIDDYRAHCPIFVGSSLNEPVLSAELDRASDIRGTSAGLAFLITPEAISEIRRRSLEGRGVRHIQGGIDDFVDFLRDELGDGWSPAQVLSETSAFDEDTLRSITKRELAAAQFLKPITMQGAKRSFSGKTAVQQGINARNFLTGFPATWDIAASDVAIKLGAARGLRPSIEESLKSRAGLFTVLGPAGSGKSTAAMQALLDIQRDGVAQVYELDIEAPSLLDAINVLSKIDSKKKIVFIPILYTVAGVLLDNIPIARSRDILFVSTARNSEWESHLFQRYGGTGSTFELVRFGQEDFDPLIARLISYVPAPKFIQLPRDQQRRRLQRSHGQLLVALREATESRAFDDIITDEFDKVPAGCAVDTFILIGISTIARVGIRPEFIVEALAEKYSSAQAGDAIRALSGIIYDTPSKRLFVRHEMYVRRVFSSNIKFAQKLETIISLVKTYTKYQLPVVKNTSRPDGILFRFVLNREFIRSQTSSVEETNQARRIFEEVEVPFQLDGHFWLQYGLYEADLGNLEEGISKLEKSLQAFPSNTYAKHALASLRLRFVATRGQYDAYARKMIDQAVGVLRELVPIQQLETDQYPLVTLALRHTGSLIALGQNESARANGANYLAEVQRAERSLSLPALTSVKECLVRYLALGVWEPPNLKRDW